VNKCNNCLLRDKTRRMTTPDGVSRCRRQVSPTACELGDRPGPGERRLSAIMNCEHRQFVAVLEVRQQLHVTKVTHRAKHNLAGVKK